MVVMVVLVFINYSTQTTGNNWERDDSNLDRCCTVLGKMVVVGIVVVMAVEIVVIIVMVILVAIVKRKGKRNCVDNCHIGGPVLEVLLFLAVVVHVRIVVVVQIVVVVEPTKEDLVMAE